MNILLFKDNINDNIGNNLKKIVSNERDVEENKVMVGVPAREKNE